MFNVGDIIVAKRQLAGCSYNYVFAKVVKVLQTNRFRIRLLPVIRGESRTEKLPNGSPFCIYTPVKPDTTSQLDTSFIISSDGYRADYGWFLLYTEDMNLEDYVDCGD